VYWDKWLEDKEKVVFYEVEGPNHPEAKILILNIMIKFLKKNKKKKKRKERKRKVL